ncbi:Dihydroorotate dehydrogenase (quinone) [BD1-7 clade bacterium]|uniref:Dihydroorotate dehydrogenase (quinone) n=1 Tax=BD1-7 clade bacterium TaxID=2029982 RepID=A0A5S9PSP5_9GAMM|nr:Dihydroorotate dehydrogenase (quinone) [BD1-7 clade bacterium]
MYALIRPLLFQMDPEKSHNLSLKALKTLHKLHLTRLFRTSGPELNNPVEVMGINFPNAVGIAAGLDKNGDYIDALGALGFGFVEIGTITPRPQPGNPMPRLFRLKEHQAIINRMGFNNKGVDYLVSQVKQRQFKGILGINIGKNKDTPNDKAVDDYLICMDKVYAYADYITVNLSSPNTPGLRDLQFGEPLRGLLKALKQRQTELAEKHGRYVPLTLKVAPDMAEDDIADVSSALLEYQIDGLIATNTTIGRDAVQGHPLAGEAGGLSGFPVQQISTQTIKLFHSHLGDRIPIIGVGGILDTESAAAKRAAGASLVQIYSGFIYRGAALIKDAARAF